MNLEADIRKQRSQCGSAIERCHVVTRSYPLKHNTGEHKQLLKNTHKVGVMQLEKANVMRRKVQLALLNAS